MGVLLARAPWNGPRSDIKRSTDATR
jgi:hypothetical protein